MTLSEIKKVSTIRSKSTLLVFEALQKHVNYDPILKPKFGRRAVSYRTTSSSGSYCLYPGFYTARPGDESSRNWNNGSQPHRLGFRDDA
jgi:hypothetical protein